MGKDKITAIVLAGGSGTRMESACKKQYMEIQGKPLLYYSLQAFQKSSVDEIILVANEINYCKKEIIEEYGFHKVVKIVTGGAQRFHSVYAGLLAIRRCDYALIHDAARPLLTEALIESAVETVKQYGACVVGMPVKDTIKIADEQNFVETTPPRERVWQIQTPQAFSYPLLLEAYQKVIQDRPEGITDDAMVMEYGKKAKVKLLFGSYENIKITTKEDLKIAELFLKEREKKL